MKILKREKWISVESMLVKTSTLPGKEKPDAVIMTVNGKYVIVLSRGDCEKLKECFEKMCPEMDYTNFDLNPYATSVIKGESE